MSSSKKKFEVHIIPGTHWDREWRFSFQETRQRLIEMLERVMDVLEKDGRVRTFTLDGQVMALEDYLELRPHNRARVEKLVRNGRLQIGPWFSLPDMPVLTGESIVRNLLRGVRTSESYGGSLMECFTSSSWGQISQMPQIVRGFGMNIFFAYHGVPGHRYPVEFEWEGADGSRVLFVRPPSATKSAFWKCERLALLPGLDPWLVPGSPLLGNAYRLTDLPIMEDTPFYGDDVNLPIDYDLLYKTYRGWREAIAQEVTTPHLFFGELNDIQQMHPDIARMVEEIKKRDDTGDLIHFSSVGEYFRKVQQSVGKLKLFRGEMRIPAKNEFVCRLCVPLSSRIYLKQANREAENLLTNWAEPLASFAWLNGGDYPDAALQYAWRMMLVNHAHDNIGGCSVDYVHDDMSASFRQVRELGRALLHRSAGSLARKIGGGKLDKGEFRLIAFNPLPFARSETLEALVDVDASLPFAGMEALDSRGRRLPCRVISVSQEKPALVELPMVGCPKMKARRVRVALDARNVPSLGYAEYRLRSLAAPAPETSGVACGKDGMENECLKVTIKRNGTFELMDKTTGQRFKDLHYFEDRGQIRGGRNPWYFAAPEHDRTVTSLAGRARVKVVHQSALQARIRVEYDLRVPESLAKERSAAGETIFTNARRSDKLVCIPIASTLTLRKGARRLDIETTLTNRALDHRLRVMFPSDVKTDRSWADAPFDVVSRRIAPIDRDDWHENRELGVVRTHPMLNFVDAAGPRRSLAILADGLPEYEIVHEKRRTIAVTLLRAFFHGYVDSESTPPPVNGSQCLGEHTYRYSICPHSGGWAQAGVLEEALRHNLPLKGVQCLGSGDGELPSEKSFLEFRPAGLLVSAIKKSEDGDDLIVRIVNPFERTVCATMSCGFKVSVARLVNLLEKPEAKSRLKVAGGNRIALSVGPKKIVTLRLQTAR